MTRRDLVFELGTEELPSSAVYSAVEQLQVNAPRALADARLTYDTLASSPLRAGSPCSSRVSTSGRTTRPAPKGRPRRPRSTPTATPRRPPTASPAARASMSPTSRWSMRPASLRVRDGPARRCGRADGAPRRARVTRGRHRLGEVDAVGQRRDSILRPVRWLLALFGSAVVPVSFGGLTLGRRHLGHRFLAPGAACALSAAFEYLPALEHAFVLADQQERAERMREGIEAAAAAHGGQRGRPDEDVCRGREPRRVADGRRRRRSTRSSWRCPARCSRTRWRATSATSRSSGADGSLDNRFIVAHNGDPARTEAIVARSRARDPGAPRRCGVLLPRGPAPRRSRPGCTKLETRRLPGAARDRSARRSRASSAWRP